MKRSFYFSVMNAWFGDGCWTKILFPLSLIFTYFAKKRKYYFFAKKRWEPPVPIVVVGNITVGGTGKTPVVVSIVKEMQARGYYPGIISRGFGVRGACYPIEVTASSAPEVAGDEPVMLAKQLNVPVVVDPNRLAAAQVICDRYHCNLIIADDGLQHYNLKRHVELLVIDGQRMLGNGLCLPAGPLRESSERLQTVDIVLSNGKPAYDPGVSYTTFSLVPQPLRSLLARKNDCIGVPQQGAKVHAVAGIGNPNRFFNMLLTLGFEVIPHVYPDHHTFTMKDIFFDDDLSVIMTAKDAVKCLRFASSSHWYLPVAANIPDTVFDHIDSLIESVNAVNDG